MRVIAGKARGMRLECPPGDDVRPAADMARQALFNILREYVSGTTVLDLFAGAGTVGIEALSRGAAHCVFVEKSPQAIAWLEKNLAHTRLAEFAEILQRDAFRCVERLKTLGLRFDMVHLGPPFPMWHDIDCKRALIGLLDEIAGADLLAPDAALAAQHEPTVELPTETKRLTRFDLRRYGRNAYTFYELKKPSHDGELQSERDEAPSSVEPRTG